MGENEGRLLEYLWIEMSLVSLADSIPPCRALLEQLGRPLVDVRVDADLAQCVADGEAGEAAAHDRRRDGLRGECRRPVPWRWWW